MKTPVPEAPNFELLKKPTSPDVVLAKARNQSASDFMVERIKNKIQDRGNIFWSLTVGVAITLGLYLYFLSNTVHTTFLRQQTEKSIAALEENSGNLESSYLNLKNAVTIELARAKGFKDIVATQYISRKSLGVNLSMNSNLGI